MAVDGVRRFLAWADGEGRPAVLDRASVNAFTAVLLAAGAEPATARARQLALRRFSAWLFEEGQSDVDHGAVAWRPRSGVLLRRAAQDVGAACPRGRDRGVSAAPAAAHRGAPLAGRRRREGGLMAVAGWTHPDMLLRYTCAQASARAAAKARTLGLGDF